MDINQIKNEIRRLSRVPIIEGQRGKKNDDFLDGMYTLFLMTCRELDVNDEARYLDSDNDWELNDEDDLDELKADYHNIVSWYDSALATFAIKYRNLVEIQSCDIEYGKHFPTRKLSLSETIELSSKNNTSYFYSNITPDIIDVYVLALLDYQWTKLKNVTRVRKYDCYTYEEIGASHGAETKFMRVEFNIGVGLYHSYPISESDCDGSVITQLDELQGYGEKLSAGDWKNRKR
jgi:hypothetical protein